MRKTFYSIFNEVNIDSLEKAIDLKVKEDNKVAFYPASFLDLENSKKSDLLTSVVSSFANSEGGIIIIGMKCQRKKAVSIDYINSNISQERLKYFFESSIYPIIDKLEIFELGDLSTGGKVFVLSLIHISQGIVR